ncbi:CKLF-like MARVEL transmembrane domain-containing protein 2 [Castor canadensis]|uniref:CKLF-like MARVEL transmembrane domain-containing protein 2 n=1 Tax=Castor canadensis TaxID=51338 RepID=UPI003D1702EC
MPPKPAAKKEQPKDSVGTRKGYERYVWELKDNNKEFWMLGHAPVKIVSLICLLLDMYLFSLFPVHPILTLILTMELSILLFFIVIHTLAINRYLVFILWPITDILNDLLCGGFLLGGLIFAVHIRRSMPMSYFVAVVRPSLLGCGFAPNLPLLKN